MAKSKVRISTFAKGDKSMNFFSIDALDESKRKIRCIKTYEPRYPNYTNGKQLLKRGHTYTLIGIKSLGFFDVVVLEEFPTTVFDARLFKEIRQKDVQFLLSLNSKR